MAETRKRPHTDDAEQSLPKKRAVSEDKSSASHVNGVVSHSDEPKDDDRLELFRKDAIYRRMKHYSREYERSEARVAELERRRSTCEAGLAALEACWTQIIGTIRMLVKPEDLPPVDVKSEELYDLTVHVSSDADPDYLVSLRSKMQGTTELVSAFMRLAGHTQANITSEEEYRARQKVLTEESTLRAELSLARTKLRDMETDRDNLREQAAMAEKRLDRLQSKVVHVVQSQPANGMLKTETPSDTAASPAPPQVEVDEGGGATAEEWQAIAKYRSHTLAKLRMENDSLKLTHSQLIADLRAIPEAAVTASPYYQMLREQANRLELAHQEDRTEVTRLEKQLVEFDGSRTEFRKSCTEAADQEIHDWKVLMAKRDNDNARLRDQRDQLSAELHERKQREQTKLQSLNELRQLAESRSQRLELLKSEVIRLKSGIAAQAGDQCLMSFLLSGYSEDMKDYVEDVKNRLAVAEGRIDALMTTLSERGQEHPGGVGGLRSEVDIRERLAVAEKELQKYRSVYGNSSALPPDLARLSEQLQQKEGELQRLTLQLSQQQETEATIYTELDKLSAAWESLDKQLHSKIFDLTAMEERLAKCIADKAKSDNKYYAAMRDKEASESERKQLSRKSEKQVKAIDKLMEVEQSLTTQITSAERELSKIRLANAQLENADKKRKVELESLQQRVVAQKQTHDKTVHALKEQYESISNQRSQIQATEESLLKREKELERQAAKLKASSQNQDSSSSVREAQLQKEVDQCMSILKCSTCRQNMRNTVITKCMHSFCKNCVDARIATRQRKCPACNLAFSQGEVQQLFFQ